MTPRGKRRPVHGVLLVDKPAGMSSNAALQKARYLLNAEKAGHTGTLDPFADGLLPVCLGEASKFASWQLEADKRYRAQLCLGVTTTTGDPEGEILSQTLPQVDQAGLQAVLAEFRGESLQTPPMYSALKVDGKPLYEYARAGIELPRKARPIQIHDIRLLSFDLPYAEIEVLVSSGTYVRTLAEDIGRRLQCGAHLVRLTRLASGGFSLDRAIGLAAFEALSVEQRESRLLPADALVGHLPRLDPGEPEASRLQQGQRVRLQDQPEAEGRYRIYAEAGFVGLADLVDGGLLVPLRMMQSSGVNRQGNI